MSSASNTAAATASAVTPSLVPPIVIIAGIDVPIMALGVSVLGLLLARSIAPASRRKLSKTQERCLTALLILILFLIITGQIGGKQLGAGIGFVWGIGLGMSGLLVVEFFGQRVIAMLYAMFGQTPPSPGED